MDYAEVVVVETKLGVVPQVELSANYLFGLDRVASRCLIGLFSHL